MPFLICERKSIKSRETLYELAETVSFCYSLHTDRTLLIFLQNEFKVTERTLTMKDLTKAVSEGRVSI